MSYYGTPYAFLMFALRYNASGLPDWIRSCQRYFAVILLVPIILWVLFTPMYTVTHPIWFKGVVWWAGASVVLGAIVMLFKREMSRTAIRTHLLTSIAVIIPMLYTTIMNYVLPSFGMYEMWRYNTWIIAFGAFLFLIGLFTFGFLDVKLLVQRRRLVYTLKAITSGTAILNHAIKNDIGKIRLFGEKLKSDAFAQGNEEAVEDIQVMLNAAAHIQAMMGRVQQMTRDVIIQKQPVRLMKTAEQVLHSLRPMLEGVDIDVHWDADPVVNGDPVHLQEVLHNIIANAVEAMNGKGAITLRCSKHRKHWALVVEDSGPGLSKAQLQRVMEPFYTTKGNEAQHFGLGLAYCYSVMEKHGGWIELHSKQGEGLAVTLLFPKRKGEKPVND